MWVSRLTPEHEEMVQTERGTGLARAENTTLVLSTSSAVKALAGRSYHVPLPQHAKSAQALPPEFSYRVCTTLVHLTALV